MSVPTEVTLARLAGALREQGGLLADALLPAPAPPEDDPALGALAAAGPRSACHTEDVAFVIETIREGYLLHYATGRLLRDDDRDLVLLAGDHLYAAGLARLAALGDLDAVAELSDVISLCAQAQAEGRPDLAEAVWTAEQPPSGGAPTTRCAPRRRPRGPARMTLPRPYGRPRACSRARWRGSAERPLGPALARRRLTGR